ncbi:MAG TPA: hypothetical protein VKA08_17750 [Balneolales bacterium]|nr:hypothetical protein [Balneolales bacterium]
MGIKGKLVSAKSKVKKDAIYRRAYIWIALIFVFIGVGFFPSYFSRLSKTDLAHHIHAIIGLSWMVLVLGQTYLIGHGDVHGHRKAGILSFILAPSLVITGIYMTQLNLADGPLGLGDGRLGLAYENVGLLLYFSLFVILAFVYRHDFRRHQRFMVCTAFVAIPPAVARIPVFYLPRGMVPVWQADRLSLVLIVVITAVLLVNDWRKGKLYFAYAFTFIFFLVQIATVRLFLNWHLWLEFSHWLAG